jgi:hypothetical protein
LLPDRGICLFRSQALELARVLEIFCKLLHARRRPYLGGRSSPFNQPVAVSDLRGSGRSQSRHWNVRGPLPPGGSAKTLKAPQPGQVDRSAWPINKFCRNSKMSSIQNRAQSRKSTTANW